MQLETKPKTVQKVYWDILVPRCFKKLIGVAIVSVVWTLTHIRPMLHSYRNHSTELELVSV